MGVEIVHKMTAPCPVFLHLECSFLWNSSHPNARRIHSVLQPTARRKLPAAILLLACTLPSVAAKIEMLTKCLGR